MRISNTSLALLAIGLFAIIIYYVHHNTSGKDLYEIDAGFLVFGVIVLTIPFGLVMGVLVGRIFAEKFVAGIFMGRSYPDTRKYSRARMLVIEEKFEDAIHEFMQILEKHPGDCQSQEEIARICADNLKDYSRAIMEYEKLLAMKIDDNTAANALNRLADIHCDHYNDTYTAAEPLEEIIRRFPDTPHAQRARIRLDAMRKSR